MVELIEALSFVHSLQASHLICTLLAVLGSWSLAGGCQFLYPEGSQDLSSDWWQASENNTSYCLVNTVESYSSLTLTRRDNAIRYDWIP